MIGFNMKYITFSEKIGILSDNQRIGIITLLPKGLKDKKSLEKLASDNIVVYVV